MDERDRTTRETSTIIKTVPSFGREVASVLFKATVILVSVLLFFGMGSMWYEENASISDGTCNIAVLPLEGAILPYDQFSEEPLVITPRFVRTFLDNAENDPMIQGILVEINSPGGTPVASEQIAELLHSSTVPVVGLVGDIALSGGYLVAAGTHHLVASQMSNVGSMAVTMSYLEQVRQNDEEGLDFIELTSGEFKEAGNPNRPLSDAERALFQENVELVHDVFTEQIATYRDMELSELRELANGSLYVGVEAVDLGLVDELGGRQTVRAHYSEMLGLSQSEITFCEYEFPDYFLL